MQSTDAALHRAQTLHYIEHKSSIRQTKVTLMHVAALYLVIRKQLYAEHRCSITPSIGAALNIRTLKAVLH